MQLQGRPRAAAKRNQRMRTTRGVIGKQATIRTMKNPLEEDGVAVPKQETTARITLVEDESKTGTMQRPRMMNGEVVAGTTQMTTLLDGRVLIAVINGDKIKKVVTHGKNLRLKRMPVADGRATAAAVTGNGVMTKAGDVPVALAAVVEVGEKVVSSDPARIDQERICIPSAIVMEAAAMQTHEMFPAVIPAIPAAIHAMIRGTRAVTRDLIRGTAMLAAVHAWTAMLMRAAIAVGPVLLARQIRGAGIVADHRLVAADML